jgi:hypothetical protein
VRALIAILRDEAKMAAKIEQGGSGLFQLKDQTAAEKSVGRIYQKSVITKSPR